MGQFWRTSKFRCLNKEWNKKLKDSEFEDAEIDLKGDRSLKQRSSNCYRQATQLERESRLDYYLLVGSLANDTEFETELEKLVMIRHAEGATIKEIVEEIKRQGMPRERRNIRHIIRRWQAKWGIRSWTLKQMNLKAIK